MDVLQKTVKMWAAKFLAVLFSRYCLNTPKPGRVHSLFLVG